MTLNEIKQQLNEKNKLLEELEAKYKKVVNSKDIPLKELLKITEKQDNEENPDLYFLKKINFEKIVAQDLKYKLDHEKSFFMNKDFKFSKFEDTL